jgi:lipopolysaccharide export system protein LptA
MGLTPARLRTWILAVAGLLILAIAAFLLYGRWQGRRLGRDLPEGLSSSIQQSTNGFTYSESRGGHTIYTLHASKAVQYKKDGHAELHDVSITLYSAQGTPDNRIYGSSFDWDPVQGIARAMGEVQIDFQPSPGGAPGQNGDTASEDQDSRNTVHVKTSGLVFNKKTGLASTDQKIEFRLVEAAGSAIGASFDSQSGVAILSSEVAFNSSINGDPLTVRAHHAQYDRTSRLLYLLQEETDYAETHSASDQATVSLRADGSASQVKAEGHVVVSGTGGQQLNANVAHLELGPKSEPRQAVLDGGLLYVADGPARVLHGSAASATLVFGPQVTLRHAQLNTAVSVVDQEKLPSVEANRAKPNTPVSTTREMQAAKADIDFLAKPGQEPQAQHILANGGARVNVRTLFTKASPEETTVRGDQLFATLANGEVFSSLKGTGHTSLNSLSSSGATQNSSGDSLELVFAPAKAATNAAQPAAQLESAVQTGNVTLVQQAASAPGEPAPSPVRATAAKAAYDAKTQIMELTGSPRIEEVTGELAAAKVTMDRATGNADATGGVKATYRQAGSQPGVAFTQSGPVHVVADRAHLDHVKDLATFFGSPSRLWQGSDSVSAPVLELSRKQGTLFAHGEQDEAAVHAVFTSTPSHPGAKAKTAPGPSVVRVESRTLLYGQNDHKAVFSGAVVAQTTTGLMHASAMDVYFTPVTGTGSTQKDSLSKIVARGDVQLNEPGRKGSGEELTYTAADGKFLLTGSPTAPPRLTDEAHGSVTGNALIFNDRDDSVVVSGGTAKVVTQTRVAK